MTKPAEHLPLTHHGAHSPPILSVPFDPRPPLGGADEPAADLRGHLNTL